MIRSKPKTVRKPNAHVLLEMHMRELGLAFKPEYHFHPTRKWRFDYLVWVDLQKKASICAVEIEGGIWMQGRHTRGAGYAKDLEKYREAARLGYKVYRFSTQEVMNGTARQFLAELEREG